MLELTIDASEVAENLSDLVNKYPDKIKNALEKVCLFIEEEAKAEAPVRDGQLVGSISHEVGENEGSVFARAEYAPYVEFGTGIFAKNGNGRKDVPWRYEDSKGWHTTYGQVAQPFLEPAAMNHQKEILDIFVDALGMN